MIEVNNLVKKYDNFTALNSISFKVGSGSVVGFLGPNGAGKTTTMRIISGYMPPDAGRVSIDGLDVVKDPFGVKKVVGYMPEDNPLYHDMTGLDYLEFCARMREMSYTDIRKRIREVVDICSLEDVIIKPIGALSKGYRQRVGLAQAILHDPPILILDEPTSGLDPNQIREIRTLIGELKKEKTIVLSTHIMQEVQAVCERVIIINRGEIAADGTHQELAGGSGKTVYSVQLDGPADEVKNEIEKLDTADYVRREADTIIVENTSGLDPRKDIFSVAVRNNWAVLEMSRTKESLEDIFRKLTEQGEDAGK
ncbi:MAG: ATP-binding cassette domain-containing protein [Elusimicrobia bacterium]|nr:ATP-binding cassette domain-containing protein [Elusimicrobiota bacterium]